jgi:hypothetical protein
MKPQPPKREIPDQLKQIIDLRNNKLAADLSRATSRIQEIEKTDRVELDEFYFSAFLPFFAGDENLPYPVNIETWINVAGGAFNEVDVVKVVDGKKTVLFTVPSVLNRNLVKPTAKRDGEPSVMGAVINASNITNHSPEHALLYLRNYLDRRRQRMVAPEFLINNAEAWNKIFAHYGRPPMVPQVASEAQKSNSSNDEVVGFDPL